MDPFIKDLFKQLSLHACSMMYNIGRITLFCLGSKSAFVWDHSLRLFNNMVRICKVDSLTIVTAFGGELLVRVWRP